MTLRIAAIALGLSLASAVVAQGFGPAIQQRWPGVQIRKVTEGEFQAFAKQHPEYGSLREARTECLQLQYAACGFSGIGDGRFLSPGEPSRWDREPRPSLDSIVLEGAEPNGDPAGAPPGKPTAMICNSVVRGRIGNGGDHDWYRFDLTRGTLAIASTGAPTNAPLPLADTALDLLDADGRVLDANDDEFFGSLYSRVERVLPPGRYYLAVRGVGGAIGDYSLQLECLSGYAGMLLRGVGCPGSNGVPTIRERVSPRFAEAFEAPVLGSTFSFDGDGLPPFGGVAVLFGFSDTVYAGFPLPFDLGLLGAPGCLLRTSVVTTVPMLADSGGRLLVALDVPYHPGLVGGTLYAQWFAVDSAVPVGFSLSNTAAAVIGTRVRWRQRSFP